MNMTERQLRDIFVKAYGQGPLAHHDWSHLTRAIMEADAKIGTILKRISFMHNEQRIASENYKAELERIESEVAKIQGDCDHEWTTVGDPSGGRDHETSCTICGARQ